MGNYVQKTINDKILLLKYLKLNATYPKLRRTQNIENDFLT